MCLSALTVGAFANTEATKAPVVFDKLSQAASSPNNTLTENAEGWLDFEYNSNPTGNWGWVGDKFTSNAEFSGADYL